MPTRIVFRGGDSIVVSEGFKNVCDALDGPWDSGWVPFEPLGELPDGGLVFRHRVRLSEIVRIEDLEGSDEPEAEFVPAHASESPKPAAAGFAPKPSISRTWSEL